MSKGHLSVTFILAAVLFLVGCGGPPAENAGPTSSGSGGTPALTKEVIDIRINDARVYEVMPESGSGEPIAWSFDEDEPKEIVVVDQQVDGTRATVILDIKTQSAPYARNLRYLHGQMRTDWALETGWVLRRWEIINTENISMKYRDLAKPSPQPSGQDQPSGAPPPPPLPQNN